MYVPRANFSSLAPESMSKGSCWELRIITLHCLISVVVVRFVSFFGMPNLFIISNNTGLYRESYTCLIWTNSWWINALISHQISLPCTRISLRSFMIFDHFHIPSCFLSCHISLPPTPSVLSARLVHCLPLFIIWFVYVWLRSLLKFQLCVQQCFSSAVSLPFSY